MKVKIPQQLSDKVSGVLTIELTIPREQEIIGEFYGVGEEERQNLIGQRVSEILSLLGVDED